MSVEKQSKIKLIVTSREGLFHVYQIGNTADKNVVWKVTFSDISTELSQNKREDPCALCVLVALKITLSVILHDTDLSLSTYHVSFRVLVYSLSQIGISSLISGCPYR